jgi:hypothetical protein
VAVFQYVSVYMEKPNNVLHKTYHASKAEAYTGPAQSSPPAMPLARGEGLAVAHLRDQTQSHWDRGPRA